MRYYETCRVYDLRPKLNDDDFIVDDDEHVCHLLVDRDISTGEEIILAYSFDQMKWYIPSKRCKE